MTRQSIDEYERLIRRDPARRGLIASEPELGPLCPGHLRAAAADLCENGRRVVLATGFFIPFGDPPAAETDGLMGTLLLASTLESLGVPTLVLTDRWCETAVCAVSGRFGYSTAQLEIVEANWTLEDFRSMFARQFGTDSVTHLIAVERVGPSHTLESLSRQKPGQSARISLFEERVTVAERGRCFNMRGKVLDEWTGSIHVLFERAGEIAPGAKTIGVGDGGNEIGMGSIPWDELARRIDGPAADRIPCRVPTDWTIVAGVSDWGGYALAAATARLAGSSDVIQDWDARFLEETLEHAVVNGPCVDGVTGRQEATVDGLPFITYVQPWLGIRRVSGG